MWAQRVGRAQRRDAKAFAWIAPPCGRGKCVPRPHSPHPHTQEVRSFLTLPVPPLARTVTPLLGLRPILMQSTLLENVRSSARRCCNRTRTLAGLSHPRFIPWPMTDALREDYWTERSRRGLVSAGSQAHASDRPHAFLATQMDNGLPLPMSEQPLNLYTARRRVCCQPCLLTGTTCDDAS